MSRKEISENVKRKLYAESIYTFLTLITLLIFVLYQEGYFFIVPFMKLLKSLPYFYALLFGFLSLLSFSFCSVISSRK